MKKILLIDAHPDEGRFSSALLAAYEEGAKEAGFIVSRLTVRNLQFELNLRWVATVLSTISGSPFACATLETLRMSRIETFGLPMVSAKKSFVFGFTAACHSFSPSWFSTKVTSMPSLARVYLKRL